MTTEIAILNHQAVALAADSAATVGLPAGSQKIYTSANKIFGLSRRHPVAVMIYNAGAFMGVPWETVVKLYRDHLADSSSPTVAAYLADFISYLPTQPAFCTPEGQQAWFEGLVRAELEGGRDALRVAVEQALTKTGADGIDEGELSILAANLFGQRLDHLRSADLIDPAWGPGDFETANRVGVIEILQDVFGGLPLTDEAKDILVTVVSEFITRQHESNAFSGVVAAGFGHDEIFPSLWERVVDGVAVEGAAIVPFAQDDMVRAFVEGVSPSYQSAIEALISRVISGYPEALLGATTGLSAKVRTSIEAAHATIGPQASQLALEQLAEWRSEKFVTELIEIVSVLPKEELASLAEALVNLTSLRRRMSRQAETVGGPVDVAVISKGDGLIWMKRKHYFEPGLNPQYMANRYGSL